MSEIATTNNPLALIDRAIEKGVDAEQLSRLMDLQERWEKARAIEAYNRAMNACQGELPVIVKDAENTQTRSAYARLETVVFAMTPVLAKNGFSLSFSEVDSPRPDWVRVECTVMHTGGHTVQHHGDFPVDGIGAKGGATAMNRVQAIGSTLSYARRYLACSIFNVAVAGLDTDAAQTSLRITEEQEAQLAGLIDLTETNLEKFLNWANIAKIGDMTPKFFPTALDFLKRKQQKAAKEAKGGAA